MNNETKETVELSEDDVNKRNKSLDDFFKNAIPNKVIRRIGDNRNPAIVIDFEYILSCHVMGFNLHFQKENKGETIFTIKLGRSNLAYNESEFSTWLNESSHKKIHKIALDLGKVNYIKGHPELFLSGWNFRNKILKEGKYPVFSEFEPKVYFKLDTAEDIAKELADLSYSVKII